MPVQAPNDVSLPQSEAQTLPPQLPMGDASYFTQSMESVNTSLTEIRLALQQHVNEVKVLTATIQGKYDVLDTSLKAVKDDIKRIEPKVDALSSLKDVITELKPKIESLNKWRWVVITGIAVFLASSPNVAPFFTGLLKAIFVR